MTSENEALREKVSKAIADAAHNGEFPASMYLDEADAAIAAVLDAMQEPSEGMRGAWASSGKHDDWRKECDIGWQAMLAAFREEQGI